MTNITDLLNKRADDVEKPKPLPPGHYLAIVSGPPKIDVKQVKGEERHIADLSLKILSAGEDVDQDHLAEAGGIGNNRLMRFTFWLDEESLWKVKDTAITLGLEVEGQSIGQILQAFPNTRCTVKVVHTPARDGSGSVFANIQSLHAA